MRCESFWRRLLTAPQGQIFSCEVLLLTSMGLSFRLRRLGNSQQRGFSLTLFLMSLQPRKSHIPALDRITAELQKSRQPRVADGVSPLCEKGKQSSATARLFPSHHQGPDFSIEPPCTSSPTACRFSHAGRPPQPAAEGHMGIAVRCACTSCSTSVDPRLKAYS